MLIGFLGPIDERWDICFIAEYPSVEVVHIYAKMRLTAIKQLNFSWNIDKLL